MKVIITEEMKQEAEAEEERLAKKHETSITNRTCRNRQNYIATLGELAFEDILYRLEINRIIRKWEKHPKHTPHGVGDTYDFIIELHSGQKLKIDVKTSMKWREVCINKWQYKKALLNKTLLVGTHINEKSGYVEIGGWCWAKDLKEDKSKTFYFTDRKTGQRTKSVLYARPFELLNQFKKI